MLSFLLDILFPSFCLHCKTLGEYLCDHCRYQQRYYAQAIEIEIKDAALDTLFACCTHTDGARQLVKTLKYRSAFKLTDTIAKLMVEHIPFPDDIDVFVSIPLHKKRQQERGFNQAELLARQLSEWLHIPYISLLLRPKYTSPQAHLNREQRLTHLSGAFEKSAEFDVENKVIAVIDDVATTGTTLNEAAKVLKQHGAKKVYGIVFAHGK